MGYIDISRIDVSHIDISHIDISHIDISHIDIAYTDISPPASRTIRCRPDRENESAGRPEKRRRAS